MAKSKIKGIVFTKNFPYFYLFKENEIILNKKEFDITKSDETKIEKIKFRPDLNQARGKYENRQRSCFFKTKDKTEVLFQKTEGWCDIVGRHP